MSAHMSAIGPAGASCTSLFSSVAQPVLRAINECPRIRADIRARAVVRAPIGVAAALLGPRQRTRSGSDYDGQSLPIAPRHLEAQRKVSDLNNSPVRWFGEPTPAVPYDSLPGFALA